jgi:hypothetical protein
MDRRAILVAHEMGHLFVHNQMGAELVYIGNEERHFLAGSDLPNIAWVNPADLLRLLAAGVTVEHCMDFQSRGLTQSQVLAALGRNPRSFFAMGGRDSTDPNSDYRQIESLCQMMGEENTLLKQTESLITGGLWELAIQASEQSLTRVHNTVAAMPVGGKFWFDGGGEMCRLISGRGATPYVAPGHIAARVQ